jgi:ribosomal protein S18 acetylase RimI-like enzyme
MTFFVRTASAQDLAAIRDLLIETWHDTYDAIHGAERVSQICDEWHSLGALRARLASPNSEFLVADDGKQIAGMAFAEAQDEGKTVRLHQLYVRPDFQGGGIGGMLFDEVESCFPDGERVRLEVDTQNTRAIGFYVSLGFAQVSTSEDCASMGAGLPALIYEKPIVWADE